MGKAKILLFVFTLLIAGLKAQQPLWHISLIAEQSISEVGHDKIQSAWFVTGKDTVYTLHLKDNKIVGRTTPYDFDTIWTDGDSLYQRHIDFLRDTEERAAYSNTTGFTIAEYKQGALAKKSVIQNPENENRHLEKVWTPKELLIIDEDENRVLITTKKFDASSINYLENRADTMRRWDVKGNDTVRIVSEWDNYSEVKKFDKRKWSKTISSGDTTIQTIYLKKRTDSTFKYHHKVNSLNEHYTRQIGKRYILQSKYRYWWEDGQDQSYELKAYSDTARHVWIFYKKPEEGKNVTAPKIRWKYFYDSDSIFFKSYEIIYDQQDAQVALKIKRKDGTTTTIAAPSYPPEPDAPEMFDEVYPIAIEEHYSTKLKILSPTTKKTEVDSQTIKELIVENIHLYELRNEHVNPGEWWQETIIIEIGADRTITGVSRSPSSELWVDEFLRKTKDQQITTPKKLKTVLYYIDNKGKKRKQKIKYILLPVELQARNEME